MGRHETRDATNGRLVNVLSLRAVTIGDWPLWRDARIAALTEAPHAFKSRLADWHPDGERRWRSRLEMPGTYNIVAMLDGHAIGTASGVPGDNGVSELRSVWVAHNAQGRGVGGRLIAGVEAWAVRTGATTLTLTVIPGNEPAIALYRRHGFALTGRHGALLDDGVTREQVMAKPLSAGGDDRAGARCPG